jgi:hypothetical protein
MKAPITKNQAPEKHQAPSYRTRGCVGVHALACVSAVTGKVQMERPWNLGFGYSLVLGYWLLGII